ncbi:MAG: formylglycine-generating enzyme family protein [Candidatus Cloacimonetes bacterium]|nr:formylglycine-generating enzyme family protein [Candidatus Cloacimonadota bacterium]MDY0228706.1 formylglycine-generating enzyme family protein [Candidatus Cloacimonadaceae bacterium]
MNRLTLLFAVLMLAFSTLLFAETIAYQGFEEDGSDTWDYTANTPGSGYWGIMDAEFGGTDAQSGEQYWVSWLMGTDEGSIEYANQELPLGYVYSINFYYYSRLLDPATDFCRYSLSYDDGLSWSEWTELLPDTQAWTEVAIEIPDLERQVMLKVSTKHNGTSKYAHWDSFALIRQDFPPQAPVIYNVQIAQHLDGSGYVDIYYDLFDGNQDISTISLLVSEDAGATYAIVPDLFNLSGDIGAGIASSSDKHLIWDAGAESLDLEGDQYRFRLLAEDNSYPPVAIPVFTPVAGTYVSSQTVSISCATADATIRYTTNGSEPNESSPVYSTPLTVASTTTLKAKAYKAQWSASETATALYTITTPEGFVYVPGGSFTMGDTRGGGFSSELPTHSVTLSSFYMGKYEVTQAEYADVMGSNPSHDYGVGDNYPAYNVSWYSMIKYCNLRSIGEGLTPVYSISGSTNPTTWGTVPTSNNITWNAAICDWAANGYRLPTEAEWEYAARGATNTPDYLYSGSDDLNAVGWYSSNSGSTTHLVGSKAPNALGLYDMSGNLHEWCWDWWDSSYYSSSSSNNPTGPNSGSYRVLRGGFWNYDAVYCRVAYRNHYYPNGSNYPYGSGYYIGFRLCRAGL